MHVALFMIGTIVIQGGLVLVVMRLLTGGEGEARREEETRHGLAALEAEERRLPKAA